MWAESEKIMSSITSGLTAKGKCIRISLSITSSPIEINGFVEEADMLWKWKDKKGHVHQWKKHGKKVDIPTTRKKQIYSMDPWDGDVFECTIRVCKKCGEEVHPKFNTKYTTKSATGLRTVEGKFCTPEKVNVGQIVDLKDLCKELCGEMVITGCHQYGNEYNAEFSLTGELTFCWKKKRKSKKRKTRK